MNYRNDPGAKHSASGVSRRLGASTAARTLRWAVTLAAAVLCPNVARADAGVPGFKRIESRVVIDNLADYPEYHFFWVNRSWNFPTDLMRGERPPPHAVRQVTTEVSRTARDNRFELQGQGELIGIPRPLVGADGQPDWDALARGAPGVLRSNRLPLLPGSDEVPSFWPLEYTTYHFHLDMDGGRLALTPGPVERYRDDFNLCLPALLLAAAATGFGLWIVRRRRKSRPSRGD